MSSTALISVSDRTHIRSFARRLAALGYDLVATGGTAAHLRQGGLAVMSVSQWTGHPEMLDGRVKTLHPRIHAAILADRSDPSHMASLEDQGLAPIDLVVANLYPFREKANEEAIDIGGVAMLRAAAKNWAHVVSVSDPADYEEVARALEASEEGGVAALDPAFRRRLAGRVFEHTARYDAAIAGYLRSGDGSEASWQPTLEKISTLRYGENPHQAGALYRPVGEASPVEKLHGHALGYNNVLDLDGALQLIWELEAPAAAIIKHTNPAGCATGATIEEAFQRALAGDPISAYGSIVALNRPVSEELAARIDEGFVEILAAPEFEEGARRLLETNERRRLMRWDEKRPPQKMVRSTAMGWLVQDADPPISSGRDDWSVATEKEPTPDQWADLHLAWKVVKHVKSNAIVIAYHGQVLGVGAGQMSRVDAVGLAIDKCVAASPRGAVLASDAFFPFRDAIDRAAESGISAVIQPGGSRRDQEVIDACDERQLAMVMTGTRHFRH